ncbi:MAG: hypothetical protein EA352_06895 [Gemmatimonadales bacterium]|nr:MAG: hypothetical protein EA352_06895 [Gemmatimonadales bacterium]
MTSLKTPRIALVLAGAALALALWACADSPLEAPESAPALEDHSTHLVAQARPASPPAHGAPDLALIRAGSAPYRNVNRAIADGFVDVSGCVEAPPIPDFPFPGAMGHHFLNFERLADIGVDPRRPEILLYAPNRQGGLELVGVEFAVNAEAWHALHGDDVFPEVAGASFDPPNPAAESPIVQTSYTLHVWNWTENPNGMFVPFNPAVSCGS